MYTARANTTRQLAALKALIHARVASASLTHDLREVGDKPHKVEYAECEGNEIEAIGSSHR